jgi:hypothetical protein
MAAGGIECARLFMIFARFPRHDYCVRAPSPAPAAAAFAITLILIFRRPALRLGISVACSR